MIRSRVGWWMSSSKATLHLPKSKGEEGEPEKGEGGGIKRGGVGEKPGVEPGEGRRGEPESFGVGENPALPKRQGHQLVDGQREKSFAHPGRGENKRRRDDAKAAPKER